ncbi:MAG: GNAT family N-acetyltransferase [Salaquimonas sp.]|nr:GNAT family N-acetyltransferase [Salaquimonas sp.]
MNAPDTSPDLGRVRRMEAVAFRSFPATTTYFDGTWAIRLTAGHPAKRLNSVNPLDPSDTADLSERIETAARRFEAYGRPLIFRHSPLAPKALESLLEERGWKRFEESLVMTGDLKSMPLADAVDRVPLQDTVAWVDAADELEGGSSGHETNKNRAGLLEVISHIEAEVGLFALFDQDGAPLSVVRCVRDRELAGIFDLATHEDHRREGHGAAVLKSALKWASGRGATTAWLQVVADNAPAVALYRLLGFEEIYRYTYLGASR